MKRLNLAGHKFGRWTVIQFYKTEHPKNYLWKGGLAWWFCKCDCGQSRAVRQATLLSGQGKSCGCLAKEISSRRHATHRMTKTKIYVAWLRMKWLRMKSRCYYKKNDRYQRYGGRGISVCDRWRNSFESFAKDIGPRPGRRSLGRINNDGNYEPSNCRWATKEQQYSTRTYRGIKTCLS